MNILFVDQFSEPGAHPAALLDAIDGAEKRGWSSRVMAPGRDSLVTQSNLRGIPVHVLPLRPLSNGRRARGDALRFLSDLPGMKEALRRVIEKHERGR